MEPFFDREALTPGRSWQVELERAMSRCRAAAILLGPFGLGTWQREEVDLAIERQKSDPGFGVIPVLLPGADAPLGLLALRTWIDLLPSDEAALDMLAAAIRGDPPSIALQRASSDARSSICPFRGLAAFREEDAPFFFGRERIARELQARMTGRGLTALIGPSGSGKSSIAQAGLLPLLRRSNDRAPLIVAVMQPRTDPFVELARQFVSLREPDLAPEEALPKRRKIAAFLTDEPAAAADWFREVVQERGGGRFLLLIDQFEELYTAVEDEAARNRFIDAILLAIDTAPLSVLVTLRGDYLAHALGRADMVDRLQSGTVVVGPMDHADLRRAIEEPASKLGVGFQVGLVERMMEEVKGEPGMLPLLQFLLEGLWHAHRQAGALSHGAYEALGGVRGAIAKQAESVFATLTPADQAVARDLLVSLVRPGEGTLDSRRFVDLADLPEVARHLVYSLGDKRLVVANDRHVEVAHEALIREWKRLRDWVMEDREFLRARDRLEPDAIAWTVAAETGGVDDLLIPTGRRLEEARELLRQRRTLLETEPVIRRYIEASVAQADALAASAERSRRVQVTRARGFAAVLGLAFVCALAAAGIALSERSRAFDETERAQQETQRAQTEAERADREAASALAAKATAEKIAADLRAANVMSVTAGDRFVTRVADRLRQISGIPVARIEELLTDGEDFFTGLADRAGGTPELARNLARMQVSFARTSQDLGDLGAVLMRARQARQQLEPALRAGQATAEDLAVIADAYEVEADAEYERRAWDGSAAAAEQAHRLWEQALAVGADPVQVWIAIALDERLAARALAKSGKIDAAITRATSCLQRLDGLSPTMPSVRYARALCLWARGYALMEGEHVSEARSADEEGLALIDTLIAEDRTDRRYQRLRYVFKPRPV
jgi:hypothetical protein